MTAAPVPGDPQAIQDRSGHDHGRRTGLRTPCAPRAPRPPSTPTRSRGGSHGVWVDDPAVHGPPVVAPEEVGNRQMKAAWLLMVVLALVAMGPVSVSPRLLAHRVRVLRLWPARHGRQLDDSGQADPGNARSCSEPGLRILLRRLPHHPGQFGGDEVTSGYANSSIRRPRLPRSSRRTRRFDRSRSLSMVPTVQRLQPSVVASRRALTSLSPRPRLGSRMISPRAASRLSGGRPTRRERPTSAMVPLEVISPLCSASE